MKSIKIENLRGIKDTGDISFPELTILIGKNSVGKSSFLRAFPLLKQSISTTRTKPIIWYTDELVDFGSYSDAIRRVGKATASNMSFSFKYELSKDSAKRVFDVRRTGVFLRDFAKVDASEKPIEISQKILFDNTNKIIAFFKLLGWEIKLEFPLSESDSLAKPDVYINGTRYEDNILQDDSLRSGNILPMIYIQPKDIKNSRINNVGPMFSTYASIDATLTRMREKLECLKSGRTSDKTIEKMALTLINKTEEFSDFERDFLLYCSKFKLMHMRLTEQLKKNPDYIHNVYEFCGVAKISKLIQYTNTALNNYFQNVQYLAPVRAGAQRYYRRQDLAVNDISPEGNNIPAMLSSMKVRELREWQEWTKMNFGISYFLHSEGNNDSIYLRQYIENNVKEDNLSDVGFGYSQVLPILLYSWRKARENGQMRKVFPTTLLIEQPELHLHPAMQAKEMHSISQMVSTQKNIRVVLETHSEYMIKQMATDVANNLLRPDQVKILIFDSDSNGNTEISEANITEDGFFVDWPLGFFEPNYK